MSGLVTNDKVQAILMNRHIALHFSRVECGQCQSFNNDLHPDKFKVPALVGELPVELGERLVHDLANAFSANPNLLGDLLGGGSQASEDQAAGEQAEEEEKPEDDLENVVKKLFDR